MNIAIIPARGGSKRIPRKNVRLFTGKPMIAYALAAAQKSGLFDKIIVSTDDPEIAEIAQQLQAEVPFIRPAELAGDHTPTVPVIAHAITECRRLGWEVGDVCCIYACVPFIQIDDIHAAYRLLHESGAGYAFPIAEFPSAIQRALRRSTDGLMQPFYPEYVMTRTQDLEPSYYDAGQFYWGKAETWCSVDRIHAHGVGLPIPAWRVVDVDTPADWERAEMLFHAFNTPRT